MMGLNALRTLARRLATRAARRPHLSLLFAALASVTGCKQCGGQPPRSWYSEGGELGQRMRAGKVPGATHQRFTSQVLGRDVGLVVLTPPEYATRAEQHYPVVYVFPGIGGDEWTYANSVGLESSSLKALFAAPDKAPIVVFANPGDSAAFGDGERVLADELVAFVDRTYRTHKEAAARSLEGFSLGGVTALTLLARRPQVFGRAAASSSACYLLDSCGALREHLRASAKEKRLGPVLLAIGAKEGADNRAVNDELAHILGVPVLSVPGVDHDWGAQLATRVDGVTLGERIAAFHLAGFAR